MRNTIAKIENSYSGGDFVIVAGDAAARRRLRARPPLVPNPRSSRSARRPEPQPNPRPCLAPNPPTRTRCFPSSHLQPAHQRAPAACAPRLHPYVPRPQPYVSRCSPSLPPPRVPSTCETTRRHAGLAMSSHCSIHRTHHTHRTHVTHRTHRIHRTHRSLLTLHSSRCDPASSSTCVSWPARSRQGRSSQ